MIPTTETLTQTAGAAECQYEVRRGSVDGPPLRYAVIGEPVFHVWKCDTGETWRVLNGRVGVMDALSAGMRILIRDCYVDDGGGNKVATIDSRGYAIDKPDVAFIGNPYLCLQMRPGPICHSNTNLYRSRLHHGLHGSSRFQVCRPSDSPLPVSNPILRRR